MRKAGTWMFALALLGGGAGCVSQDDYNRLNVLYQEKQAQVVGLQARVEENQATIGALQEANATAKDDLRIKLANALEDREKLNRMLTEMERRVRDAGTSGALLPPDLDIALRDLAASNPDLLSFDSRRGMVKISSDLTFDSGSAAVQVELHQALEMREDGHIAARLPHNGQMHGLAHPGVIEQAIHAATLEKLLRIAAGLLGDFHFVRVGTAGAFR